MEASPTPQGTPTPDPAQPPNPPDPPQPPNPPDPPDPPNPAPRIAGVAALKGLLLYGATLTFAGIYIDFIVTISRAHSGAPKVDGTLISAASALAGVLGSAFALAIGTTTDESNTNQELGQAMGNARSKPPVRVRLRRLLSLEPKDVGSASWPQTAGIWVYAAVASAVAVTYILNQNQTPPGIKALAVAFAGYVITFLTSAYHSVR